MAIELLLMTAVVLAIAIVISIGHPGISYLGEWLKSWRTRSRKTKTDPTA